MIENERQSLRIVIAKIAAHVLERVPWQIYTAFRLPHSCCVSQAVSPSAGTLVGNGALADGGNAPSSLKRACSALLYERVRRFPQG